MLLDSGELIVPLVVLIKSASWLLFMPLSTYAFDNSLELSLYTFLSLADYRGKWKIDQCRSDMYGKLSTCFGLFASQV